MLEFDAGIFGGELPVGFGVVGIAVVPSPNAFTQLRSCVGCTFRSADACAYETPRSLISRTASSLNSRVNLRPSMTHLPSHQNT